MSVAVPVPTCEANNRTKWWSIGFALFTVLFITALAVMVTQREDLFSEYVPPPEPEILWPEDKPYSLIFPTSTDPSYCSQSMPNRPNYYTCSWPGVPFGSRRHASVSFQKSQWEDIAKTYNVLSFGCYGYFGSFNQTSELSYSSSVSGCEGDFVMCYAQLEQDLATVTGPHVMNLTLNVESKMALECISTLPVYYLWIVLVSLLVLALLFGILLFCSLTFKIEKKEICFSVGTWTHFVGYFFLGAFVPFVTPILLLLAKQELLKIFGAAFGTIGTTISIGYILQIVLHAPHLEYIVYITTAIALLLFAGVLYMFITVFLPIYDKSPESHFQLLEQDSSIESWGTSGSTTGWFFLGLLLPLTGTFFCICYAPLKGRWACWAGSAAAGFFHVWSCEAILVALGSIRHEASVYCSDFYFLGTFELFASFMTLVLTSTYYYLRMRPLYPREGELIDVIDGSSLELSDSNTSQSESDVDLDSD